jgi:hypothetical protein
MMNMVLAAHVLEDFDENLSIVEPFDLRFDHSPTLTPVVKPSAVRSFCRGMLALPEISHGIWRMWEGLRSGLTESLH